MHCVICLAEVTPVFNWTYFLSKEPSYYLCDDCRNKLALIEGERCKKCSRPLEALADAFIKEGTCHDCLRWEQDPAWKGVLDQNTSLFLYNDFIKETIARFKYRGDYEIAGAFSLFFPKEVFTKKVVVPIPLSDVRLYERGFNQAEALITCAGLKAVDCLERVHSEKQSKKSRDERLENVPTFKAVDSDVINAQNILLVDDIYTTGATLRRVAKVLKEAGAKSVDSFTIAR
ncbi:ComF family protein [Niallia sp. 03133]|uniref:ComF family protein n=1 Tax=Niallia sp. 03133 TaxID=3458060 RepID=UPI004043A622